MFSEAKAVVSLLEIGIDVVEESKLLFILSLNLLLLVISYPYHSYVWCVLQAVKMRLWLGLNTWLEHSVFDEQPWM